MMTGVDKKNVQSCLFRGQVKQSELELSEKNSYSSAISASTEIIHKLR